MRKEILFIAVGILLVNILTSEIVFAQDAIENPEEKAEEIHKIASSDMIYTDEELKALYYQNVQIIGLLKEIRDLLNQQIKQEKK